MRIHYKHESFCHELTLCRYVAPALFEKVPISRKMPPCCVLVRPVFHTHIVIAAQDKQIHSSVNINSYQNTKKA